MKTILEHIESKQQAFEKHPFFSEILCNTNLTGEQRLSWAPMMLPFVLGYADLNKYIFRNENAADDPIQAELNAHTYEEESHHQWMLADLEALSLDPEMKLSDTARMLWSTTFSESRVLTLRLAQLAATYPSPYQLFTMIESIEAVSITVFKNCRNIKNKYGKELQFFGNKHYNAEANHEIHHHGEEAGPSITLDETQQTIAIKIVDAVFELLIDWTGQLHAYSIKQLKQK